MKRAFAAALAVGLFLALSACARSDDDIRRIANESLAIVLASVPTSTAAPTVTPQPTATPVPIPFTPTPFALPPFLQASLPVGHPQRQV